jgi:hypothetical protein
VRSVSSMVGVAVVCVLQRRRASESCLSFWEHAASHVLLVYLVALHQTVIEKGQLHHRAHAQEDSGLHVCRAFLGGLIEKHGVRWS